MQIYLYSSAQNFKLFKKKQSDEFKTLERFLKRHGVDANQNTRNTLITILKAINYNYFNLTNSKFSFTIKIISCVPEICLKKNVLH